MMNNSEVLKKQILYDAFEKLKAEGIFISEDEVKLSEEELKYINIKIGQVNKSQLDMHKFLDLFQDTKRKIYHYRDEFINGTSWDHDNDVRITILNQLDTILIPYTANMYFMITHILNHDFQFNQFKVPSFDQSQKIIAIYHTSNQTTLLYNLSSIIERFLRLIAVELDPTIKINDKIYRIRTKVFQILNISIKGDQCQALRLLTSMRNCIHNNGIHVDEDREIIYKDVAYSFVKNIPHNYATYEILNNIVNDVLGLVKIINTDPIINFKISIFDDHLSF